MGTKPAAAGPASAVGWPNPASMLSSLCQPQPVAARTKRPSSAQAGPAKVQNHVPAHAPPNQNGMLQTGWEDEGYQDFLEYEDAWPQPAPPPARAVLAPAASSHASAWVTGSWDGAQQPVSAVPIVGWGRAGSSAAPGWRAAGLSAGVQQEDWAQPPASHSDAWPIVGGGAAWGHDAKSGVIQPAEAAGPSGAHAAGARAEAQGSGQFWVAYLNSNKYFKA